jgi:hypothetical protein
VETPDAAASARSDAPVARASARMAAPARRPWLQALVDAAPGDYLIVRHRGHDEWHERLVTFRSELDDRIVMLTPDEDHYVVEPASEFDAVYAIGPREGLPSAVRKSKGLIYRFDERYEDVDLDRILDEGREIAVEAGLLKARGGRSGRGAAGSAGKGSVDGDGGPGGGPVLPLARARGAGPQGSAKWRLAEPTEEDDVGLDVTAFLVATTVDGVHGFCLLKGNMVRANWVEDKDVGVWQAATDLHWENIARRLARLLTPRREEAAAVENEGDARVLSLTLDDVGRRDMRFADAVRALTEVEIPDWDFEGPRTTLYCAKEMARTGGPPTMRFRQWKSENRVGDEDAGVDFLEVCHEVLELAITRDQLNIGNLLCFERLERKRQMIEESYRQRAEEVKLLKAVTTNPMAVTAELFAGRVRMAGGAIVSPRLIEFVARQAAANSDILKQQRKALEFRGLAAPKAAGKK